jgi:cystathionine beta-lyase/cystathionine gamma-synthase
MFPFFSNALSSHPNQALALLQMNDWEGMLSFQLQGGIAAGRLLYESI